MTALRDQLLDADPLSREPFPDGHRRERARQAVIAATGSGASGSVHRRSMSVAALAFVTLTAGGMLWSRATVNVTAAIRFELRLAEDAPASGLREARGPAQVIYLHPDPLLVNGDIAGARVVSGDIVGVSHVELTFTDAAAERLRQATADHLGRPIAILLDGDVVAAPVLRSPVSNSAVLSGRYTRAEAERIATGVLGF